MTQDKKFEVMLTERIPNAESRFFFVRQITEGERGDLNSIQQFRGQYFCNQQHYDTMAEVLESISERDAFTRCEEVGSE